MRTLKEDFFDNLGISEETQIREWLDKYGIKNYSLNDDLTIDVKGDVDLRHHTGKRLPDYIQFGKVTGDFNCSYSANIESLKGAPQEVSGDFFLRKMW